MSDKPVIDCPVSRANRVCGNHGDAGIPLALENDSHVCVASSRGMTSAYNFGRIRQSTGRGKLMKPYVRAAVAYVAGRAISRRGSSSVYDYSASGHRSISGSVTEGGVSVYDHTECCHFSGSGNGSSYRLYHYGESAHVSLSINGESFSGYDYGTSSHFSWRVSGASVSLYDYSDSRHYSYSV